MPSVAGGYLLGLGSNIEPEQNVLSMVELLLKCFSPLHLSRVVHIPPVGMNSHRHFLNAVAFIETDMAQDELKRLCNQIEVTLGRDRCDPNSKHKDRPADLDILCHFGSPSDWQRSASSITDEYFLYPLMDELRAYIIGDMAMPALQQGTALTLNGLTFGETATTIHRN